MGMGAGAGAGGVAYFTLPTLPLIDQPTIPHNTVKPKKKGRLFLYTQFFRTVGVKGGSLLGYDIDGRDKVP